MIEAVIKTIDKRTEENSNKAFRYSYNIAKQMLPRWIQTWKNYLNKIVDKQKKTSHKTGSLAVTNITLGREEKKRKKENKGLNTTWGISCFL